MSQIHLLDESTINQIAAGEVVERPSAVVKELIENAMDAGATAITSEIKEGGLSFIRITDNGSGIAREDIPLAFLRHATSKIRCAEDLLSVTSLGFRGEALSSVSAVSQLELITKTPSVLNGFRYIIEGGEEKSFEEIGCPGGTTIIIRNLFYNTPARRKFLKSAITEAGYISDLMERLIISHPDISFKYIVNNQVKLQSSGNNNRKDILYQVYGRDITKELLPIEFQTENLSITGYIGKPIITRGNRNFENYYINGRYIKSNIITKAIEEAYKPFLMQHKYPFTSMYFVIPPSMIDVNVHPQKMEIRLKNSEEVYHLIYQAVKEVLTGKELIPKVTLTRSEVIKKEILNIPEPFEENRRKQISNTDHVPPIEVDQKDRTESGSKRFTINYNNHHHFSEELVSENKMEYFLKLAKENETLKSKDTFIPPLANQDKTEQVVKDPFLEKEVQDNKDVISKNAASEDVTSKDLTKESNTTTTNKSTDFTGRDELIKNEQINLFSDQSEGMDSPFLSKKAFEEHRIIGQVFSTYWLVEYKKELYIIDQHAAHEKVLYERILAAVKTKTFVSQQLLPPIVLSLTIKEQEVIRSQKEALESLGYEFEHFGGNEFSVRAVPADLYGISEKDLLLEFIDHLTEDITGNISGTVSVLERIASLSCKAAVKANHTFTDQEARALIKELLTLENPYHCPHGRPVIVSMSQNELERRFKRVL